ncbi:hypothetical protein [Tenacibaculum mesophilum]|uniref:Uncharacterized protein n=1 Tax=Tenacibaculum mesophilum TaxID=104268 RepID=A0AAE9MNB9_9FLAO|nr:hypothetical protein [Tenacibaculum mesophilum]UTD15204.1 hypothetical protein HER15_06895 [Tenacibaculum mesophilum]
MQETELFQKQLILDIERIFKDLENDLKSISPKSNERLLKEEQVRSCLYFSLKNQGYFVSVERNYSRHKNIECDIVFWKNNSFEKWVEIKTSHYSELKNDKRRLDKNKKDTWINKPKEQINNWLNDFKKLERLDINKEKYFFLVEQHSRVSLFDIEVNKNDEIKKLKSNEIMNLTFELEWPNAPVDFCTLRLFKL